MEPNVFPYFIFFSIIISSTTAFSFNITAVFAFGDATVDSGNNNHIRTIIRSNHTPYGQDFPNRIPTGRFTNGKLMTDYLISYLRIKDLLPAYFDPRLKDVDLLTGVSFASAGSGYDDLTASLVNAMNMTRQVECFCEALRRMKRMVGEEESRRIIGNAMFVISAGSSDMMSNMYDTYSRRRFEFPVPRYHYFLIRKLYTVIQRIYNEGGRRLIVTGIPPIGCLPIQVTLGKKKLQRECILYQNRHSRAYNRKLKSKIRRLQVKQIFRGANINYLDVYYPIMDMIRHPAKYGFHQTLSGCCGTGLLETGPLCRKAICGDASKYIFWDAAHPTQAAYSILATLITRTSLAQLLT